MQVEKFGQLYVVATPIGNLKDITIRAIETLNKVDKIVAEDTRLANRLLAHYSIQKPILMLNRHTERKCTDQILTELERGMNIAIISDAGTPLISDPGFLLVKEAINKDIKVTPIPGPCAAVAAISVSGCSTETFAFKGFLPAKASAREKVLLSYALESNTLIFYEAPHRLMDTLESMQKIFGTERCIVIARELTKIYESIKKGSILEIFNWFKNNPKKIKGEFVIVVEKETKKQEKTSEVTPEMVLDILLSEVPLKQAVLLTSKITHASKNKLYELALLKR